MNSPTVFLALICMIAASPAATSDPSTVVKACLDKVALESLNTDGGCIAKISKAGPKAIERLRQKLDLTAAQPGMRIVPPAARMTRAPTGEVDVWVELTNPSAKMALVRTNAIDFSVRVVFETFGFTWDNGASAATIPHASRHRIPEVVVLAAGESCNIVYRIPLVMSLRGRYSFDYTIEYDGPLTIPQDTVPGWVTSGRFHVDYLERPTRGSLRPLGNGTLRIRTSSVPPVSTAGEPIPVNVSVTNLLGQRIIVPQVGSFYSAPYWFVIVDPSDSDKIMARGNVILLEEMTPEKSSAGVMTRQLAAKQTIRFSGVMQARLRPGTYAGFIGYTVFRDSGDQDLWIGEAASVNFTFAILP